MLAQINELRGHAKWFKANLNKSASLDVTMWHFASEEVESIEYRFYLEGIFNNKTHDLNSLVKIVATIRKLYEANMEVAA